MLIEKRGPQWQCVPFPLPLLTRNVAQVGHAAAGSDDSVANRIVRTQQSGWRSSWPLLKAGDQQ